MFLSLYVLLLTLTLSKSFLSTVPYSLDENLYFIDIPLMNNVDLSNEDICIYY